MLFQDRMQVEEIHGIKRENAYGEKPQISTEGKERNVRMLLTTLK